jgi:hypothetical protein
MDWLPNKRNVFKVWDGKKMHLSPVKLTLDGLPVQLHIDEGLKLILPDGSAFQSNPKLKRFIELQFIGFSDKNGENLFEADIVSYHGQPCVILWNEISKAYHFYTVKDNKLHLEGPVRCSQEKEIEILGNILENPEFIKPFRVQINNSFNNARRMAG